MLISSDPVCGCVGVGGVGGAVGLQSAEASLAVQVRRGSARRAGMGHTAHRAHSAAMRAAI